MIPSKVIAEYLAASGIGAIGAAAGLAVAFGAEPDKPIECTTVYDTGGLALDTDELDMSEPSFQIRTRSTTYQTGYDRQLAIRQLLSFSLPANPSGFRLINIKMTSDILPIGRDDNNRFLFTCNYSVMIQSN